MSGLHRLDGMKRRFIQEGDIGQLALSKLRTCESGRQQGWCGSRSCRQTWQQFHDVENDRCWEPLALSERHIGKGGHIRTVPVPNWVKSALDAWTEAGGITGGKVFRWVNKNGSIGGTGITEKVVRHVVRECAARAGLVNLAPHDLRRTCARLCHLAGGELEQVQFLLGHVSVQTTEQYLGCRQSLKNAVSACIGIEPDGDRPDR